MSIIDIAHLTFAYDGSYDYVFEDVSFHIDTDWRLGLIGRNGRGKTTLLKLLEGVYEYSGSVTHKVIFDYFPFEVPDPQLDTLDTAYSVREGFALWALKYELSLLEMPEEVLYRPFCTLSHGERVKVLLALLFLQDGGGERFLLIDEPTDHLDENARKTVAGYLRSKKGFILVSHDRLLLDGCIDHVLSLNRAGVEIQSGNFSSWFHNRQLQDQFEMAQNRRIKKEIKRLESTAREKAAWSDKVESTKIGSHQADRGRVGHLAAKAMKRSKTIEGRVERRLEEKAKLLKNIEKADSLTVTPLRHHAENLLMFREVSAFYGNEAVCEPVSFSVSRGERVAVRGKNGAGKSSLLKLCLSAVSPLKYPMGGLSYTGEIQTASNLVISYVSQDTTQLSGDLKEYCRQHNLDETLFKAILRKLDFTRTQFDKDMRDFSSGQKKKVLIAQSLCEHAHLYIWDEPLNFIDVLSRVQIEALILAGEPAMLFVEHDGMFRQHIATKSVLLHRS